MQYTITAFYRNGDKPDTLTGNNLVALKSQAQKLIEVEGTARVIITAETGEQIFNEVGDFVE